MNEYIIYFFDDDLEFLDIFCKEVVSILKDIDITYRIVKNSNIDNILNSEINKIFFLDIEMPQINGLNLGKIFRQKFPNCTVIYVSSHDNYVFDSFESKPFGFIQKKNYKIQSNEMINRFFNERLNVFEFKFDNIKIKLKYNDILYIRKFVNNVEIVTAKQIFKYRTSLDSIQNQLDTNEKLFFRIHKSIIINLNKVQKFDKNIIFLYNGEKLTVSRNYLVKFKSFYYNNHLE